MGVNITLESPDESHSTDLCSNGGYSLLAEWLEGLAGDYPALGELAEKGTYTGTTELVSQLEEAFQTQPPSNPDTEHVADRLLDLLGDGRPDETLIIE